MKTGDLVSFECKERSKNYGIIFYINDENYIISKDGEIISKPLDECQVKQICHTALGNHPELFQSLEQVKENFQKGKYEIIFSGVKV